MGTRIPFILSGAIFAGIGLFWVLSTAIESFGIYQTLASIVLTLASIVLTLASIVLTLASIVLTLASIVLTLALAVFYRIGYSDGKHACYMNAKPGQSSTPQRQEPRI
ncbi:hypothetical protein [Thiothrix winogradskyi]|uniref:Uncharacterized protein n=1 Tax=Thiothrix winogradskyi TaxID=96472 RepID=A0ABY3T284_9GAMM|nr:hypothetical protein [Thiothrix winogradskyi]UJS25937.1 hypothetical protein L2Y54_07795 [Thiothrix winogradskyi]